ALSLSVPFSLTAPPVFAQVTGTPSSGNDTLTGDATANTIDGMGGDDTISGMGGDDRLMGGAGYDVLSGGKGDDSLLGGEGKDTLNGGPGADTLEGNAGHDRLKGQDGDDILRGGDGRDWLKGDKGDDELHGGKARDRLKGGPGDDSLNGDRGRDILNGGPGTDELTGGEGQDRFVLRDPESDADNADTITDISLDEEDQLILPDGTTQLWIFQHRPEDTTEQTTTLYNAADRSGTYATLTGLHNLVDASDSTVQDTDGTDVTNRVSLNPVLRADPTVAFRDGAFNTLTPTMDDGIITGTTVTEGADGSSELDFNLRLDRALAEDATFRVTFAGPDFQHGSTPTTVWRVESYARFVSNSSFVYLANGETHIDMTIPANSNCAGRTCFLTRLLPPRDSSFHFQDADTVDTVVTITIAPTNDAARNYDLTPATYTITFEDDDD
ncbi:MAG: hypothetical protein GDA55_04805, partial [Cellvibrionales bacterium]|nr:hypothetical protein [Cellvibrionales bacterium]